MTSINKALNFILLIARSAKIRAPLALSFITTALQILSLLAQPLLIAQIIRKITTPPTESIQTSIIFLSVAMGFSALMTYLAGCINNSILQNVRRDTKHILYADILIKPPEFFRHFNEGSIESAVATASLAARTIIHDCLGTLVRAIFFITFSALLIFSELPVYGVVFPACAIVYFFLAYLLAGRSAEAIVAAVTATTNVSREASDLFSNVESIQGNDMGTHEKNRLLAYLNIERETYLKGQALIDTGEFLQKIFLTSIFIGFIISVSIAAIGNTATAIMLYIIGLLSYAQLDLVGKSLNSLFEQSHKLNAVLAKLSFDAIEFSEKTSTPEKSKTTDNFTIRLKNISFSHHGCTPIFSNLSATIEPGSRHVISGESGIGKSTLLKLISGQIEPTHGHVLLWNREMHSLSMHEKAIIMSIIPQNVTLFNRSIRENATYGMVGVSDQQLEELLLSLRLERIQRENPRHWLDSMVDKGGLNLSGGERQRILLARAILRARPLLFLDESTSALDMETEAAVLRVLHARLPNTTIIAVSHHPHSELAGYNTIALR